MPLYLPVMLLINGSPLNLEKVPEVFEPTLAYNVVIVPVRPVLESIGAKVDYDIDKNYGKIFVTYKGKRIDLMADYTQVSKQAQSLTWPSSLSAIV